VSPAAATSSTDGGMMCSPRLPPTRMSPKFGESQTYLCIVDSGVGVFLPVTAPRQDGIHVDLNLSAASTPLSPRVLPSEALNTHPVNYKFKKVMKEELFSTGHVENERRRKTSEPILEKN
jgi:hypothetical protein